MQIIFSEIVYGNILTFKFVNLWSHYHEIFNFKQKFHTNLVL